ncbi:MAG: hypothetical protein LBO74_16085 [Candidatus Symbiothrix sp.]|jgi:RimJ/RimL family protein N-acetyltransferase|nr:hypothetical protein [Candidatus Symbiothrix sp.]
MKQLRSFPVQESWQVELMRHIYNDNLDMLSTKPLPYRTYEAQQEWWNENKKELKTFLYEPIERPGKFVAFLVLRDRGGFYTPIVAIQKEEWGKKYGQEIINDYIEKANAPLAGSQLQSNKAICHINKKVGWQILGEIIQPGGKVDLLYHPGINPNLQNDAQIFDAVLDYLELKQK